MLELGAVVEGEKEKSIIVDGQMSKATNSTFYDDKNIGTLYYEEDDPILFCKLQAIVNFFEKFSIKTNGCEMFYLDTDVCTKHSKKGNANDHIKTCWILIEDSDDWKNPYSITEYVNALKEVVEEYKIDDKKLEFYVDEDSPINGFGFWYEIQNYELTIEDVVDFTFNALNELDAMTLQKLREKSGKIILEFDFPNEIASPCEQYLIYFGQFMTDLGMEVNTSIDNSNSSTLFTVEPQNKEQALEVIKDALSAYLALPTQYEPQSGNTDVAVMQLEANLLHLKSQLLLAHSVIENKNATIGALQLSIDKYEKLQAINDDRIQDVLSTDTESIIGEIVKVKAYEDKMWIVDFPRFIRNLKRKVKSK